MRCLRTLLEKRTTVPVPWSVIHKRDKNILPLMWFPSPCLTVPVGDVKYEKRFDVQIFVRSPPLFQVPFRPILSHNLTIHFGIALHLINDYIQWLLSKACLKTTLWNPRAQITCHTRRQRRNLRFQSFPLMDCLVKNWTCLLLNCLLSGSCTKCWKASKSRARSISYHGWNRAEPSRFTNLKSLSKTLFLFTSSNPNTSPFKGS